MAASGWRAELDQLLARFGRLFVRSEPRNRAGRYLEGLLGPVERKDGWQLAEHPGNARPWRTQRVLSHALWDEEAARDLCRDYAVGRLGAAGAVRPGRGRDRLFEKGRHSAGVARQYSGTAGRVENSRVGVFLAYASREGHALVDRRSHPPKPRPRTSSAAVRPRSRYWCGDRRGGAGQAGAEGVVLEDLVRPAP